MKPTVFQEHEIVAHASLTQDRFIGLGIVLRRNAAAYHSGNFVYLDPTPAFWQFATFVALVIRIEILCGCLQQLK